ERQLFAAGQRWIAEIRQDQTEGRAGVGLAARINVERLGAITVAIPLSDDVALADHDHPGGTGRGGVVLPGCFEFVPVAAGELADFGLLLGAGLARLRQQRAPAAL